MDLAVVISSLSLAVAVGGLFWSRHTWKAARRTDVRVMAQQDGGGLDISLTGTVDVEHVITVRVFNHGERPEYVMLTGLETPAGDHLVDDRPRAAKLVDDPPPELREVPSRGQLITKFKVAAPEVGEGFVGFAVLGTGERIYSVPAMPDTGIADLQAQILKVVSEASSDGDL